MKHEESRKRNAEAITSYLCGETKESICNRLGIREDRFYSMCYVKGIKIAHANNKKFGRPHSARMGEGKGWTAEKNGGFRSQFRGRCIGRFKTQTEAEMCYKKAVTEYLSQNKAKAEGKA